VLIAFVIKPNSMQKLNTISYNVIYNKEVQGTKNMTLFKFIKQKATHGNWQPTLYNKDRGK